MDDKRQLQLGARPGAVQISIGEVAGEFERPEQAFEFIDHFIQLVSVAWPVEKRKCDCARCNN